MSGDLHLPEDVAKERAQQKMTQGARQAFVMESAMHNLAARLATLGTVHEESDLRSIAARLAYEAKLARVAGDALAAEFGMPHPRMGASGAHQVRADGAEAGGADG